MEVKLADTGEYLILKLDPLETISLYRCLKNIDIEYVKSYDIDFLEKILKELNYFVD